VVAYNRWLCRKYKCHINVEVCNSVKSIKYVYKYVYKGPDRAELRLERVEVVDAPHPPPAAGARPFHPRAVDSDEIKEYLEGRYLSASEAHWRLAGFPLHEMYPAVARLQVHLPGKNHVYFRDAAQLSAEDIKRISEGTTLLKWLDFNAEEKRKWEAAKEAVRTANAQRRTPDPEPPKPEALTTLYYEFPRIATFDRNKRIWSLRKKRQSFPTVGRMYFVNPQEGERYYLRMLLLNSPGATSYEELRTTGQGTPDEVSIAVLLRSSAGNCSENPTSCPLADAPRHLPRCMSQAWPARR
jgi:hypothetical protein